MITESPQIRLHVAADSVEEFSHQLNPIDLCAPGVQSFVEIFPQITGWELNCIPYRKSPANPGSFFKAGPDPVSLINSTNTSSGITQQFGQMELEIIDMANDLPAGKSCSSRQQCDLLVQSVNGLLRQIQDNQRQIELLNAQLATAIPVTSTDDDSEILLSRLEAVIQQGIYSLDLQAGALYLLDEATRDLHLRVQVGLPSASLLNGPRRLKESIADLDALVGHPFTLSQSSQSGNWKPPADFPGALCVAVASHSTPLGTLWFYSNSERKFSGAEISIAELVGGRLAAELEKEAAVRSGSLTRKLSRDIERARLWQQLQTPPALPVVEGWDVSGNQFLHHGVGGALFDFGVSSAGDIVASVGDIQGAVFESGLAAASMRGAIRSLEPQNLPADRFLTEVNNTLWNCPLGDQIGSLFQISLEPTTGISKWANAGETGALIIGSGSEINIARESSPLGACADEEYEMRERVLLPDSTLFAFNEGFRRLFKFRFHAAGDQDILDQLIEDEILKPEELNRWVADLVTGFDSYRAAPDVSFIAIYRQPDRH